MMRFLIKISLSILLLSSCVYQNELKTNLYSQYIRYAGSVTINNATAIADEYFTSSLLGDDYKSDPYAPRQLTFHDWMAAIDSHTEKIYKNNGCLMINGYDKSQEPSIFKLLCVYTDKGWLINKIDVFAAADSERFGTRAVCASGD